MLIYGIVIKDKDALSDYYDGSPAQKYLENTDFQVVESDSVFILGKGLYITGIGEPTLVSVSKLNHINQNFNLVEFKAACEKRDVKYKTPQFYLVEPHIRT